jgi:hypothetical protein
LIIFKREKEEKDLSCAQTKSLQKKMLDDSFSYGDGDLSGMIEVSEEVNDLENELGGVGDLDVDMKSHHSSAPAFLDEGKKSSRASRERIRVEI